MPPRQSVTRQRIYPILAAVVATLVAVVAASPAVGQPPPYTLEERATAIAAPSMVYLETWATGYLRRTATGEALKASPFVFNSRCSGFAVSNQGHVVTAAHCVAPSSTSYQSSAAHLLANERVKLGTLTADQKDAFVKEVMSSTQFTGDNLVSAPTVKTYGQLYRAKGSQKTEPAWLAESITAQASEYGDVAVVKFGVSGLPVVTISPDPLKGTTQIVAIGFAGDSGSDTANYTVKSALAKVTGEYGKRTPALHLMDQDLGSVSRGGMVVDADGRIVGMINADLSMKDRPHRVITNADSVRAAIISLSVPNVPGSVDGTYRAGLDDYFGGRYNDAIKKLDAVLIAMPQHELAQSYRNQSAARLSLEGSSESAGSWIIWLLAGAMVLVLICAAAIIWLLMHQRRRQQAALDLYLPVSAAPVSAYPISGMPVSGAGYDYQQQSTFYGFPATPEQQADHPTSLPPEQRQWADQSPPAQQTPQDYSGPITPER